MKHLLAWGLGALLLTSGSSAWAWGTQGHRTIGAIADRLLSPRAHAAVDSLLQGDLDRSGERSHRTTLEEVSTWADEIRGTPAAHSTWHYDDIPVCGKARRAEYCPNGQCNTTQLKRMLTIVSDTRATHQERNEALKWVVHLVGDIHQPLHAADNDDRGGNDVAVVLAGVRTRRRMDLHGVWDNQLVRLALQTRNTRRPPDDIDALAAEAARLVRLRGQGTPDSWALESNRLARDVAYHYPQFACDAVPTGIVVLDAGYQRAAEIVVREQLLLAGGRLAGLLNRTFASP
ncbi:MAG: S1/P1 nuclease [Steroidobacteraceae bacterium]